MKPFQGESEEYRRARNELLEAEIELRRQTERVAAQRRALPIGAAVTVDYEFDGVDGPVRLSELFEDGKDTLFLYSFMFLPGADGDPLASGCPSCTSIIDGLDGGLQHITQRINAAVVAKAPIERFQEHAETRGWRHARLLSSANTTYHDDFQTEGDDGGQLPIATVFTRRAGVIHHFWSCELFGAPTDPSEHPRHVDFMWPVWAVFDATPEGRGTDWNPSLAYL